MARLSDESVRAVREQADLVELVRGRVELAQRGGRWTGRCPFHDENTPSFSIIPPENDRYYCFGCGATGDAITWMQEQEGAASFVDAVEGLAERFGIDVRYDDETPAARAARAAGEARRRLLERAADYYVETLWRSDEAAPAREYLAGRGYEEDLLRRYRVGWAPSEGAALTRAALAAGFSRRDLQTAGLTRSGGGDFFSGRITFPISDARGRVHGFGARTMDPAERAKYVNSPEGPGFQKRDLLFGLDVVRQEIARAGWVVVSEGYTDVFGLVLSDAGPAVACMGTALTPRQLREIARVATEIRVCFDSDAAGERAAWRTVEAAEEVAGLRLVAVELPSGSDPGDLARTAEGRERLHAAVHAGTPLVPSLVRMRAQRARSAGEREQALAEITGLLRRVPDSVDKDEAVRLAGSLLGLSRVLEERLWDESRAGAARPAAPAAEASVTPGQAQVPWSRRELRLLGLAIALPDAAQRHLSELVPDTVTDPRVRRALALALEGTPPDEWPEDLVPAAIAARGEASLSAAEEAELRELAYRLQMEALDRRVATLRLEGDEAGMLAAIDLRHRMRDALRGEAQ